MIKDNSTENIFAFDVQFAEIFGKKSKQQEDEDFYEKFQDLKIENYMYREKLQKEKSLGDESLASMKEEHFFNAEFIKMMDCTSVVI
jgi:hypothetical protein